MNWNLAASTALPPSQPSRMLYFLQEELPEAARNVHHVYGPVTKEGVVIAGPREYGLESASSFCGSVVRVDECHYRLYYTVSGGGIMRIAVAESDDCRTWTFPDLGQERRPSFPPNVLTIQGTPADPIPAAGSTAEAAHGDRVLTKQDQTGQPQVVRLPDDRWRMYYWHHQHGWGRVPYLYTVAESTNGIEWTAIDYERPVLNSHWLGDQSALSELERFGEKARRTNDANFVYWNPRLGCYEQFSQWFLDAHPDRRVEEDNCPDFNRMIQRRVSSDGLTFSAPELVIAADERDPWDQQFYHLAVQYHEDWYIGSLGHYRVENDQQTMDLELAFSRDGRRWERPIRGGFIPRDPDGRDSEGVYPTNAWVDIGDRRLCLYTGTNRKHNGPRGESGTGSSIMAASFMRDRMVGIAAGRVAGAFMTPVFFPQSDEIRLDATVRGWVRAELCDAWGRKLPGYHLRNSLPIGGDDPHHVLRWRDSPTAAIRHDPVRVRFELSDAEVYCVKF